MKKIKELIYHNKKILFSFFLLTISIVFLSFFLLLYAQFQKATYKTISSYSSEFFRRIDTISQSLLNNIKESSMQMFYTASIKNLRSKNNLSSTERIVGLRDLGNFVSSSEILDSVIVYNDHLDTIFSSSGQYPSSKVTDYPDQQAVDILKNPQDYPYLVPIKRSTDSKTYYSFLFYERQSSNYSALLANIKGDWYESQLWGISNENDYIIIDNKGEIVISNNNVLSDSIHIYWPSLEKEINSNITEGFIMPNLLSTQPGYLYHKIQNSNWYYVKPIDLDTLVPELIFIRNFLFVSLSIVSILIIIFILYILIRLYLPVYYTQNISQLHSGILPFGFSFPLFLIVAEHCDIDILRPMLEKHFKNIIITKDHALLRCGIYSCTESEFENFLKALGDNSSYKLYISKLCFSTEDLLKSSNALIELKNLSFLYHENNVMQESLLEECNLISGFNIKDTSSLISSLKTGNFEDAWDCWHGIFSSIRKDHYSDFLFAVRYLDNELTHIETELKLEKPTKISRILENLTNASYLHDYMNERFILITDAVSSIKQEQLADLSSQIENYISNHYNDDTFTPQQVAEAFQMNLAYLNRQYRQSSDISISDAIHRIRIEKACILLSNTDDPIETIANNVGYSNTKYFFVIFKKWAGLTPKQYRTSVINAK